jgi:hypothetical protein
MRRYNKAPQSDLTRQRSTLATVADIATITTRADGAEYKFVKQLGQGAFGDVSEYRAGARHCLALCLDRRCRLSVGYAGWRYRGCSPAHF